MATSIFLNYGQTSFLILLFNMDNIWCDSSCDYVFGLVEIIYPMHMRSANVKDQDHLKVYRWALHC